LYTVNGVASWPLKFWFTAVSIDVSTNVTVVPDETVMLLSFVPGAVVFEAGVGVTPFSRLVESTKAS